LTFVGVELFVVAVVAPAVEAEPTAELPLPAPPLPDPDLAPDEPPPAADPEEPRPPGFAGNVIGGTVMTGNDSGALGFTMAPAAFPPAG
jgi:hypothetical protein